MTARAPGCGDLLAGDSPDFLLGRALEAWEGLDAGVGLGYAWVAEPSWGEGSLEEPNEALRVRNRSYTVH